MNVPEKEDNMPGKDDEKVIEWYRQLCEEEQSRDGIILQQFSLGMIVIGVLITAIIEVQKDSLKLSEWYVVGISLIGIFFLAILILYICHASNDKMSVGKARRKIEENWKLESKIDDLTFFREKKERPPYKSAIMWIKIFFGILFISWVIWLIYSICKATI
jgi:hypothetical protein